MNQTIRMSTQTPWDIFFREYSAMRVAGYAYDLCGQLAFNEAINSMEKEKSKEQTLSLIAAVRGFLNQLEEDTK